MDAEQTICIVSYGPAFRLAPLCCGGPMKYLSTLVCEPPIYEYRCPKCKATKRLQVREYQGEERIAPPPSQCCDPNPPPSPNASTEPAGRR